jgi:hypothetical protein
MNGFGSNSVAASIFENADTPKILCSSVRWMGGRVVEGTGLENRQARKRLVGSNPTPSASFSSKPMMRNRS